MELETHRAPRIAIIGAGWAGLAAAVRAQQTGCAVTLFEAARQAGGRARSVPLAGGEVLDSGQHILLGAYTHTLALLRALGVQQERVFLRAPLALRYADGSGLALPALPAPLHALTGIAAARGWRWGERWALLRAAARWQRAGFACEDSASVEQLGAGLPPRLIADFIEPLCISALNTPLPQASAAVFLRVLRKALCRRAASDVLLPRAPLGEVLPAPALRFLAAHGATLHLGQRVQALHWRQPHWLVAGQAFDAVLLATDAPSAARLVQRAALGAPPALAAELRRWQRAAAALEMRPITCVYACVEAAAARRLPPMLVLHSGVEAPAQFVFNRAAIAGKTDGRADGTCVLAFVISASSGERAWEERQTLAQAQAQLGLHAQPLHTHCERRATFACTPALLRPPQRIAPALLACGDYVAGPYPATLEGAVMNGNAAATAALQSAPFRSSAGVVQW